MRHLSQGILRANLEEPGALPEEHRVHLRDCAVCTGAASAISTDMAAARALLGSGLWAPDSGAALERLKAAGVGAVAHASARAGWAARRRGGRGRPGLRPAVGAAAVALLAMALVGTGVAANLIKIFEPDKVVGMPVDRQSLEGLPDLSAYGTMRMVQEPRATVATSLEEAAGRSGLSLLKAQPAFQVAGEHAFTVLSPATASFTFDAGKARAAAGNLPALPANLDGSTLFLQAGPTVVETYGARQNLADELNRPAAADAVDQGPEAGMDVPGLLARLPDLAILQMKAPVLSSDGPSVSQYRDALLALPNISPALAAQIRSIGDPAATLALPIPVDLAVSRPVDINGSSGLAIGDNTGTGSAVVWQSRGMVLAVAGLMSENDILAVARSMR